MQLDTVMAELEAAGTEQNRKIYGRHGATAPCLGVSFAKMGELKKRVKLDQALAEQLWATGVADARVLATMVADPAKTTDTLLDAWVASSDNYLATHLADLAGRTDHAHGAIARWTTSDNEWIGKAGWMLVAKVAMEDAGWPDDECEALIGRIEAELPGAPNMVKDAMNSALIALGIRNERLEERAIATARRLGPIVVDHGGTRCKTPEAEPYILKARSRIQARLSSSTS